MYKVVFFDLKVVNITVYKVSSVRPLQWKKYS